MQDAIGGDSKRVDTYIWCGGGGNCGVVNDNLVTLSSHLIHKATCSNKLH